MRGYDQMLDLADAFPGPRVVWSTTTCSIATRSPPTVRSLSLFDWGCSIYGDFVYELATFVFWSPWHRSQSNSSDMASMALDHYGDMGLDVPNFSDRLRCCALHIGLVHLAYNAFLGDLETLAADRSTHVGLPRRDASTLNRTPTVPRCCTRAVT